MSATSQLRLGQSVIRKMTNCMAEFAGGSIPGVVSDLPSEAALADVRAQARDITIRLAATDVCGLGHPMDEGTPVCIHTDLPLASGSYKIAQEPTPLPNVGHIVAVLRKTNK